MENASNILIPQEIVVDQLKFRRASVHEPVHITPIKKGLHVLIGGENGYRLIIFTPPALAGEYVIWGSDGRRLHFAHDDLQTKRERRHWEILTLRGTDDPNLLLPSLTKDRQNTVYIPRGPNRLVSRANKPVTLAWREGDAVPGGATLFTLKDGGQKNGVWWAIDQTGEATRAFYDRVVRLR